MRRGLAMLWIPVFWLGCTAPSAPGQEVHGEHSAHAAHTAHTKGDHAAPELTLDDGAKWMMDDHTRQMVAETRTTVRGAHLATPDDVKALHQALKSQIDRLVAGCTMTGPAHDQLHLFLASWIPKVGALERADVAAANEVLVDLDALLVTYDDHFE